MKDMNIEFRTKKECNDILSRINEIYPEVRWAAGEAILDYDLFGEDEYNPKNKIRYLNIINDRIRARDYNYNLENVYSYNNFMKEFVIEHKRQASEFKKVLDENNIQDCLR